MHTHLSSSSRWRVPSCLCVAQVRKIPAPSPFMATQELRDLKSLFDDGILDEDEYEEKLAEINAAPAPPPR